MAVSTPQKGLLDVVSLLQIRGPKPTKKALLPDIQQPDVDFRFDTSSSVQSITERLEKAVKLAAIIHHSINYQNFNEFHQKCADGLIRVFMDILSPHDLYNAVVYAKEHVNAHIVNYALSVALSHRPDALAKNIRVPSHFYSNPELYFSLGQLYKNIFDGNFEVRKSRNGSTTAKYVEIGFDFTATDLDPEHKLAYFREDIGLNLHHRHWHEVYPFIGDDNVVKKDRRGELFYFMHEQIMARFNFERLSNGLARVEPLRNFRETIPEAYFPKLHTLSNQSTFSSRPKNLVPKDLRRDNVYTKVETIERWVDRIYNAIDRGYAYVFDNDTNSEVYQKISEITGIDELGSTMESSKALSWNSKYYGDVHNKGHMFLASLHDPDYRFKEEPGVMSSVSTAMRDPVFYRWHAFVDNIFQDYKRTLPQYSLQEKQFKGISLKSVDVIDIASKKKNIFETFWEKDAVEINLAIDSTEGEKPIYVAFNHLQHRKFEYQIKVSNTRNEAVKGTVRIFMAPRFAERGEKLNFNNHRTLFVELDKFTVEIPANKPDFVITRKSVESSVTIPFKRTFLTANDVKKHAEKKTDTEADSYCSCGWPQHLLIGRGTTGDGMLCDLFGMITDYEDDKVDDSPLPPKTCEKSALSYCGVRDKKYPDKKPMGFPFDRDYGDQPDLTIEDFTKELSNAALAEVRVRHKDEGPIPWGESECNPEDH